MNEFMQMLIKSGVERIVFSSSAAVYGDGHASFNEDIVPRPVSPYGRSKLAGEWIIEDYARIGGPVGVNLRYFNVCGADRACETGQSGRASHIIPTALERSIAGEKITINGKNFDTPDGTCVRDYIHVEDVAAANLKALTAPINTTTAINIGNSVGFSNLEIIKSINKYHGSLDYDFGDARPGDPASLISDNNRAQELLDWKPKCSDLPTIISPASQWTKTRNKLFSKK
jgi:UDP-glucose 4-epimerase